MDYPGQSKAVRAVWSFVQKIVADSPRLRARLRRSLDQGAMPYFEDGHFYSPVVHPAQVQLCRETLWPESPNAVLDVDFCHEAQRSFISTVLQPYLHDFDYGKATGDESVDHLFSLKNDQFGGLDAVYQVGENAVAAGTGVAQLSGEAFVKEDAIRSDFPLRCGTFEAGDIEREVGESFVLFQRFGQRLGRTR